MGWVSQNCLPDKGLALMWPSLMFLTLVFLGKKTFLTFFHSEMSHRNSKWEVWSISQIRRKLRLAPAWWLSGSGLTLFCWIPSDSWWLPFLVAGCIVHISFFFLRLINLAVLSLSCGTWDLWWLHARSFSLQYTNSWLWHMGSRSPIRDWT